jgi:hypothetical protein
MMATWYEGEGRVRANPDIPASQGGDELEKAGVKRYAVASGCQGNGDVE